MVLWSKNHHTLTTPVRLLHSASLCFTLPESDIEISIDTELVHQKNAQLGLKCNFIDVDSISHLKRMVELNLGDASLLNRELMLFIEQHNTTD